jgi:hypothetical protein
MAPVVWQQERTEFTTEVAEGTEVGRGILAEVDVEEDREIACWKPPLPTTAITSQAD